MGRILIGFVLSSLMSAGCRYFDIAAASPWSFRALVVLVMIFRYRSMDRIVSRKRQTATTKNSCGGPTGLPVAVTKKANQP